MATVDFIIPQTCPFCGQSPEPSQDRRRYESLAQRFWDKVFRRLTDIGIGWAIGSVVDMAHMAAKEKVNMANWRLLGVGIIEPIGSLGC